LTDLLEDAGHAIATGARSDGVGLQILGEPGVGTVQPGIGTLYLRPSRALDFAVRPAEERAAVLRDAISTGGTAVWSGPLDPDVLLDALGPGGVRRKPSAAPVDS